MLCTGRKGDGRKGGRTEKGTDGKGDGRKGDGRKRGRTDGKGTDGKGRWVHLRETKLVPAPEAVKTEAVGFLLGWFSLSRNQ